MDRSHLIKRSPTPNPASTPEGTPLQAEIRELKPPLLEIKDGIIDLILDLQVIEKRNGAEVPFPSRELIVKVDGENIPGLVTDESGLLERRITLKKSGKTFTVSVPGTIAVYRRMITEITKRDFDEAKRLEEEAKKEAKRIEEEARKGEEEEKKREEESRKMEAEKRKERLDRIARKRFEEKVGSLYDHWFEYAVQKYMTVDRRENLWMTVSEIDSRVAAATAILSEVKAKYLRLRRLQVKEKQAEKDLKENEGHFAFYENELKNISVAFHVKIDFEDLSDDSLEKCKGLLNPKSFSSWLYRHKEHITHTKARETFISYFLHLRKGRAARDQNAGRLKILRDGMGVLRSELLELCETSGPTDSESFIEQCKTLLSRAQVFLTQFDAQLERIRQHVRGTAPETQDEASTPRSLDEAVKIWEEDLISDKCWGILAKDAKLRAFLEELDCQKFPLKSVMIWTEEDVRDHVWAQSEARYSSLDRIDRWDTFKEDVAAYSGQQLEETRFYRLNRADFDVIERCKESGMIEEEE